MRVLLVFLALVSAAAWADSLVPVAGGAIDVATGQFLPQVTPNEVLVPSSGALLQSPEPQTYIVPSGRDGYNLTTGQEWVGTPNGYVSPRTGAFVSR